ncbi:MAG: nucleotide exchange factor GrpE [Proteiniphilum sp.]|jgi:molecular chaperone GrpE|uniref:nucleotide exchange factor GrpE n=1 Tax=Proteiniphilum sp. TaxID=1926877 RepID=UPI00092AC6F7|nr:nucleotide exchange factor GrpE [Proteiniphilum sp.]MEA5129194.1 nucleotide exchange factor GrpE [Proteiniphilum sp.]OJV86018.1 MAG: nucleotide exchange factor GrpE [Bacteroidia bacterium 44-10]
MSNNNQFNMDPEEINEKEFNGREEAVNGEDGDKMADDTAKADTTEDMVEQSETVKDDLRQKYDELNDSYLRLHAEFDNFRKRTLKEKSDLIKNGGERVLLDIVALVDDFERALGSLHKTEDREAMLEGMDLIYSKFTAFLKQHGVTEIEAVGQPFNADSFEAVTTIPVQEVSQKGMIVDCIQKGYRLNDKIIRFPKVIVGE